ncbi:YibE/F family protein [Lactobacillus psittaci]|uniref:Multitransmembrane protein n=1 Tax=Lactobacillus psittaci DSM 15354 TaxID=1122152 RepID=A0A0R1S9D9_9LACO|nr:YibE/F family protein [Lactobacillus psittaci]KRL62792.1 multitransmembrane protein [Lactobacillus psittaci DSM 15354]
MKTEIDAKKVTAGIVFLLGLILTVVIYFTPSSYCNTGVIINHDLADKVTDKVTDEYKNSDVKRVQTLKIKILSGKERGKIYQIKNHYVASQIQTQKYRSGQRVLVSFNHGTIKLESPKRDWVIFLGLSIASALLILVCGKRTIWLAVSLLLNWIIFYLVIFFDVKENGTEIFTIYGAAVIIFAFCSLLLGQGFNRKMLITFLVTLLGVFVSFGICYAVMILTGENGMKYETVEYATQNPRSLFLAQALLGVLGAVMDEATDIVSSLYELCQRKPTLKAQELLLSGRSMGQEIMGPLINVLVLIFMAEALPMTILYLRDNNTLRFTFEFTLSLGMIQSLMSAIGICLTAVFASVASLTFLHSKEAK